MWRTVGSRPMIHMLFLLEGQRAQLGNLPKSYTRSEIGELHREKYFHIFDLKALTEIPQNYICFCQACELQSRKVTDRQVTAFWTWRRTDSYRSAVVSENLAASIILLPWRQWQKVSPKCWWIFKTLQGVTPHTTVIFIVTRAADSRFGPRSRGRTA
jgi:hypothetical protein